MRRNPSHKTYERRFREHSRQLSAAAISARLFICVFPAGISYADRHREKAGDWARCAFLPFRSLVLEIEKDCPRELRAAIELDARAIQAKRGEQYQVSSCGQTVRLGGEA